MTQEERGNIARLIRRETCCGLMEAAIAVDKLIYALKHGPSAIMDKPRELEVTWKERIDSDVSDAYQLGREDMKKQMLRGAVEGEVCGRVIDHINVRFAAGVCKYLEPKNISHIPAIVSKYKVGDKVCIIIVKKEEE